MTAAAARAVRFDRYGGREVLYVADIEMPSPVRVRWSSKFAPPG